MNLNSHALLIAHEDQLVINEATRHQYYSTMQAEACDEDMLDVAYNRRKARALMARRDQRRLTGWLVGLSVGILLMGLLWSLA